MGYSFEQDFHRIPSGFLLSLLGCWEVTVNFSGVSCICVVISHDLTTISYAREPWGPLTLHRVPMVTHELQWESHGIFPSLTEFM